MCVDVDPGGEESDGVKTYAVRTEEMRVKTLKVLAEKAANKRLVEGGEMPPPPARFKSLASGATASILIDAESTYAASRVGSASVAPSIASSTGSRSSKRNVKSKLQQTDARAKKIFCGATNIIRAGESTSRSATPGVVVLGTTQDDEHMVLCALCQARGATEAPRAWQRAHKTI